MLGAMAMGEVGEVGKLIAELRKERRWERSQLAEKAGLAYQTIRRYERGEITPDRGSLAKLIAAFGGSPTIYRRLMTAAGFLVPPEEGEGSRTDASPNAEERIIMLLRDMPPDQQDAMVELLLAAAEVARLARQQRADAG